MKELSLSEAQFSVCWQHRAADKPSWVVLDWSWVEDKKLWKILDQSAKGNPDQFVSCVKSEFSRWLNLRKVKRVKGGTFYLVETKEQLEGKGWPEGADRYKWFGQGKGGQSKKLRVYQ
ncbi:MAG: hypothetical protein KDD43_02110 [Bdellovibrionales bacterium]|nr:hypothetical protein [Bdellovibrionales bacterium]